MSHYIADILCITQLCSLLSFHAEGKQLLVLHSCYALPPPTHRWKGIFIPFWWWVRLRRASAPHPPLKRETPHIWGVSHVHGGQRPISLEYQINHPPQVDSTSDTLVTGMVQPAINSYWPACATICTFCARGYNQRRRTLHHTLQFFPLHNTSK